MYSVVDLGGATPPPLFWVKNEEITEGRKAGRASSQHVFLFH